MPWIDYEELAFGKLLGEGSEGSVYGAHTVAPLPAVTRRCCLPACLFSLSNWHARGRSEVEPLAQWKLGPPAPNCAAAWYLETPVAVKKTQSLQEVEMCLHAGESLSHRPVYGGVRAGGAHTEGRPPLSTLCHAGQQCIEWLTPLPPLQAPTTTLWRCAGCASMAATSTWSWSSAPGGWCVRES